MDGPHEFFGETEGRKLRENNLPSTFLDVECELLDRFDRIERNLALILQREEGLCQIVLLAELENNLHV